MNRQDKDKNPVENLNFEDKAKHVVTRVFADKRISQCPIKSLESQTSLRNIYLKLNTENPSQPFIFP